jgi:hypothetical protein
MFFERKLFILFWPTLYQKPQQINPKKHQKKKSQSSKPNICFLAFVKNACSTRFDLLLA